MENIQNPQKKGRPKTMQDAVVTTLYLPKELKEKILLSGKKYSVFVREAIQEKLKRDTEKTEAV